MHRECLSGTAGCGGSSCASRAALKLGSRSWPSRSSRSHTGTASSRWACGQGRQRRSACASSRPSTSLRRDLRFIFGGERRGLGRSGLGPRCVPPRAARPGPRLGSARSGAPERGERSTADDRGGGDGEPARAEALRAIVNFPGAGGLGPGFAPRQSWGGKCAGRCT
jgi:hypothetical protein